MRGSLTALLLVLVFCLCVASVLAYQEDIQANHQKMLLGDEAFQAILQFYQYDKDIPLNAGVVENMDEKEYAREKIVFRGANDYRVPGYLAIPKTGIPPYPGVLQIQKIRNSFSAAMAV